MKIRELSLWLLFLGLCFGAGYLKGYFPPETWPTLPWATTEVEILVQNEKLLPEELRQEIQTALSAQVKITVVEDREAFTIRTITSPGYHLAIVPDHWIKPAVSANQMSNLNPVRNQVQEEISTDFINVAEDKIYSIPIFWVWTELFKKKDIQPKNYRFFEDWDHIHFKQNALHLTSNLIQIRPFFTPYKEDANLLEVAELTHLEAIHFPSWEKFDKNFPSLYFWSLATPRHSPNRKVSLSIARKLLNADVQRQILKFLPVATTLKSLDGTDIPRIRKALYIREINLSGLKTPQWLSLEQIKVVKEQFPTTAGTSTTPAVNTK